MSATGSLVMEVSFLLNKVIIVLIMSLKIQWITAILKYFNKPALNDVMKARAYVFPSLVTRNKATAV